MAWLRAAAGSSGSTRNLAHVIDQAPELVAIRTRPDVVAIRATLHPAA